MAKQPTKGKGVGVSTKHRQYEKNAVRWKRCRDVIEGRDAIIAAGEAYLPKLKDQNPQEYLGYQKRATFYNASWRTVQSLVGLLFRKPPKLEVGTKIEEYLKDVTMTGVDFNALAKETTEELLTVSRIGILVDFPRAMDASGQISVAQAEQLGLRPSMKVYETESILNWQTSFVNNRTVLSQVRLLECKVEDTESEFKKTETEIIRVLDLFDGKYRVRVYNAKTEEQIEDDYFPVMNGEMMDYIPFYILGPDGIEVDVETPVLIDLFDMNLDHWRISASYQHGCHFTGCPTPVVSGYQVDDKKPETFTIGSTTAWVFPDPQAKASYLEFTGQGLSELRENLNSLKQDMAAIGARMLAPEKAGVEASETLAMRHAGEYSILSAIAISVSTGLKAALETFCKWAGDDSEPEFEINRDFVPVAPDAQTLTAWLALVQAGEMSSQSLFNLLKRGDLIEHDVDYETEQERIGDQAPPMPAPMPTNGPQGAQGQQPGQQPGKPGQAPQAGA